MKYNHYEIIAQASAYAAVAHREQNRRGDSTVPYIVHPARVAALVTEYGGNWKAIVAAWLHDVHEDCHNCDVIGFISGLPMYDDDKEEIIEMILALTKDASIESRDDRLADNIRRILDAPKQTILIKICDRIDNLLDNEHENLWSTYYSGFVNRYIIESQILIDAFQHHSGIDKYREPLSVLVDRAIELSRRYSDHKF